MRTYGCKLARSIASYAAAGARPKARMRGGVNHFASGVQGSGRQDVQQFAECAILATPRKHGAHEPMRRTHCACKSKTAEERGMVLMEQMDFTN